MKKFDIGYPLRWILLLSALICLITGLFGIGDYWLKEVIEIDTPLFFVWWLIFLLSPFDDIDIIESIDLETSGVLFVGLILLAQWLFLRPRREWRTRLTESGRPMRTAVAVAAFMAMLLSVGLLLTLLEIYSSDGYGWEMFGDDWRSDRPRNRFYGICLGVWAVWALVFYILWQQAERFVQLRNMIHGLIAGSFLELFVAIGVYAWNRQDDDCFCKRGSYNGLVFGATVMIWAFGPGLILLFLKKQRDRKTRQALKEPRI